MARKLASIRRISEIHPIVGKDRVELAIVDGWSCMVSKSDTFISGDRCIFCEPDSVFPATEQWDFLKKYDYRIKTQKFRDGDGNRIYSQGLVLPLHVLGDNAYNVDVDDDVTQMLGITQYEETLDIESKNGKKFGPVVEFMMRYGWFRKLVLPKKEKTGFPDEVSKTDEERVQNCPKAYMTSETWIASEKVDGQSGTYLLRRKKGLFGPKYEFVVCSRRQKTGDKNSSYWKCAVKYKIEEALKSLIGDNNWVCIQGECLGPGIQKNKYGFKDYEFRAFNLIYPKEGRLPSQDAKVIAEKLGIPWVPIIETLPKSWFEDKTVQDILEYANGNSVLNKNTKREGIVFRSEDGKNSFKAVSPEFLIKFDE